MRKVEESDGTRRHPDLPPRITNNNNNNNNQEEEEAADEIILPNEDGIPRIKRTRGLERRNEEMAIMTMKIVITTGQDNNNNNNNNNKEQCLWMNWSESKSLWRDKN